MSEKRTPSENLDTRDWMGDVPGGGDVVERRRWVIWGTGREPGAALSEAERGNQVAEGIARGADADWGRTEERWVVLIAGDESSVETYVRENDGVRGYAPYLVEGKDEEVPGRPMRGTLRDDVGPRRKVNQPRPTH